MSSWLRFVGFLVLCFALTALPCRAQTLQSTTLADSLGVSLDVSSQSGQLGGSTKAQIPGSSKTQTLKDLPGVWVAVGLHPGDLSGLTKDELQTDLENQLRRARIRLLSRDEFLASPSKPFLLVNIVTLKTNTNTRASAFEVTLSQNVQLWNGESYLFGVTWIGPPEVTVFAEGDVLLLRERISRAMGQFIDDWILANPAK